jgi:FKBP-type peptidyl-prolyl cis-trans isomerase FkpA
VVLINYKGTLPGGKVFDQAQQVPMALGEVVPGFGKALVQMQRGGKYKVEIPSELAYGARAVGEIPANSDLNFEIELLDFKSRAEIEQQQRIMQQLQQMQQQAAPGAAPAPAHP